MTDKITVALLRGIPSVLTAGFLLFCPLLGSAWAQDPDEEAEEAYLVCAWDGPGVGAKSFTQGFNEVIGPAVTSGREEYDCWTDDEGRRHCSYRDYLTIPNRTYSITSTATVTCLNVGGKTANIRLNYVKYNDNLPGQPTYYRNMTLRISGAGSTQTISNLETIANFTDRSWNDGTLRPCSANCDDVFTGTPQYKKTLTATLSVQPNTTRIYTSSGVTAHTTFDTPETIGAVYMLSVEGDRPAGYTTGDWATWALCGLLGFQEYIANCAGSAEGGVGGGGGNIVTPPRLPPCTLTITTPNTVNFQPISSDDLSRNRVRLEDFTLTATKGPIQSAPCIGSVLNLPGTIKTEGGYRVNDTFWGINQSNGQPQGIGLKIYDLGTSQYLRFNHQYTPFIRSISTASETKRFRAEIAATTTDLTKIAEGDYSQVLTFEVVMP